MAHTVTIESVKYVPVDLATISGTVDGVATKATVWQSAITVLESDQEVQLFLANALINSLPSSVITTSTVAYNGVINL